MLNFPNAPINGQTYSGFQWDGEKWTVAPQAITAGDLPSDSNPLMNGVVLPGLFYNYARGDHRHPGDTSKVKPANAALTGSPGGVSANISGTLTVNGRIIATANGHLFGTASGAVAAPAQADTNLLLYVVDAANWAGIGSGVNGEWFIRTGLSGAPAAAMYISQARYTYFSKSPIVPTPGAGDNSLKIATTAFVLANPASGPYLLLSGGTTYGGIFYVNGDIYTYRSDNTGVVYLGNTGSRYLYQNLAGFHFGGGHLYTPAGRLWGNGDFATPLVNIRFAYLADRVMGSTYAGLEEPYGGGVITGRSGYSANGYPNSWNVRYRQFQAQNAGGWFAVGYA